MGGDSLVVFASGESVSLGGEACSRRKLPQAIASQLARSGYVDVDARLDGDVLTVECFAKRAFTSSVRGLPHVTHRGGLALPAGSTITLGQGTAVEVPSAPQLDPAGVGASLAALPPDQSN